MSELGPLDLQRIASLTMSGFGSSKAALDAVVEHADALCEDLLQRRTKRLENILSGREIRELIDDEKQSALEAWDEKRTIEQVRASLPRSIGIYAGLMLRSNPSIEGAETALFILAKLVDDLLQVGAQFMVGKTEAETPQSVMTASDAGKLGAAASGDFKRKQVRSWQQRADPIIREVIGKHPRWSGDRVAQDVITLARERNISLPSTTKTVAPYVRTVMARLRLADAQ